MSKMTNLFMLKLPFFPCQLWIKAKTAQVTCTESYWRVDSEHLLLLCALDRIQKLLNPHQGGVLMLVPSLQVVCSASIYFQTLLSAC